MMIVLPFRFTIAVVLLLIHLIITISKKPSLENTYPDPLPSSHNTPPTDTKPQTKTHNYTPKGS